MLEERRAAAKPLVGETLSNAYRVIRLMGEGAMGGIYEARLLRLDKRVAIKVLARELAANSEAMARFHREAEITSQLGHPHIINVFDFGTTDRGQPYLVMEYLDGEDLAYKIARKGVLTLAAAVRITRQVASALAETHAKGIVHRDLKPANVFIVRVQGEDFAKILDFGISKVRAASTALTNGSTLMGTPMYMAPEQAKGDAELDHLTDQWALACITYEMLAGRPPFLGDDTAALLYQVVHEDPPRLSNFVKDLPSDVERVVRRALIKHPHDCFPNVTAFARAFEAAAAGRPLPPDPVNDAPPGGPGGGPIGLASPGEAPLTLAGAEAFAPAPARRPRRFALLAGVAVLAIGGVLAARVSLRRPAAHVAPATAAPAVIPVPPEPAPAPEPAPEEMQQEMKEEMKAEPAAEADDTDQMPAKPGKKHGVRRRPARRAASAKQAAPDVAPAPSAPVKRKLIKEL